MSGSFGGCRGVQFSLEQRFQVRGEIRVSRGLLGVVKRVVCQWRGQLVARRGEESEVGLSVGLRFGRLQVQFKVWEVGFFRWYCGILEVLIWGWDIQGLFVFFERDVDQRGWGRGCSYRVVVVRVQEAVQVFRGDFFSWFFVFYYIFFRGRGRLGIVGYLVFR